MRKGFIPTLTALVTAFLVTSAMALGPTVSQVPDVFIGDDPLTEPYVNMFRYTDALVLWDYVTPGVATGDGSNSDTLYWAWAAKAADLSGGTGAFLDPANIVYSIIQDNAVEGTIVTPVQAEGSAAWTAEINNALLSLGGSLGDHSLGAAGALTFRNIRVSPLPDANYPAPSPSAGTPAGYLDIQEATLYVTDTVTTPGFDRALILTVEGPSVDSLSGGAVWVVEEDHSNTSAGWSPFTLQGVVSNTNGTLVISPAGCTTNNSGTALSITSAATNPTDAYYYGLWGKPVNAGANLDPNKIYRFSGVLSSSNASAANNPGILMGINGRNQGAGWGYAQLVKGYTGGPQGATTLPLAGYVWPAAASPADASFNLFDDGPQGGTITASNLAVESVDPATLANAAQLVSATSFTRNDATITYPNWGYLAVAYPALTLPTMTGTPANLASGGELVQTGNCGGVTTRKGFSQFGSNAVFTATAGKLVVVECVVSTSASPATSIPDLWLATGSGSVLAGYFMNRNATAGNGPTTTPKSYYIVFESVAGAYDVQFRIIAEDPADNGDLRMADLIVNEYDMPTAP